jgi:O-antigen ligase
MDATARVDSPTLRERMRQGAIAAGLVALAVYTVGVENPHTTALRMIGFYGALGCALALVAADRSRVRAIAREPLAWALVAMAFCGVLSALVSPEPRYSAWELYKEIGFLVIAAFASALIVRTGAHATTLLAAGVAAALLIAAYDVAQYAREFASPAPWPSGNIHKHRFYADPLLWYLPPLLWAVSVARRGALPWIAAALALYWLLIAGTGARAAWYGAIGAAILWFALHARRHRGALAAVGLALAVATALWLLPPEIFLEQAMRGVDTSHRMEGTWKPAIELIRERPWLGHGYGEKLFHAAYDAHVAAHPEWFFRHSLGPHNVLLAIWFAGGVPLIASVVAALACFAAIVARVVRAAERCSAWREPIVAAACSVLGYLIVRGMFETIGYRVAGLALGVAIAAAIECRRSADETR